MGVLRSVKSLKSSPNTPSELRFPSVLTLESSESMSSIFNKMEEDVRTDGSPAVAGRRPRPQITIHIPEGGGGLASHHNGFAPATPYTAGQRPYYAGPLTPQTEPALASINFFHAYPNKAGEFVSKQFNSFRDFTLNTAKSGLSVGEKASIWFYSRVWALSRKWFTHIFLFIVIAGYSLLGGFLFQMIEGKAEQQAMVHIGKERRHLMMLIRNYFREMENPGLKEDEERWEGRSLSALHQYEMVLLQHFKEDQHIMAKGDKPSWDFWSSVFYCGTIYTTIGKSLFSFFTNHRCNRRGKDI